MKQRHFEISCPYRKNHKDDYTGDRNKGYRVIGDHRVAIIVVGRI